MDLWQITSEQLVAAIKIVAMLLGLLVIVVGIFIVIGE